MLSVHKACPDVCEGTNRSEETRRIFTADKVGVFYIGSAERHQMS